METKKYYELKPRNTDTEQHYDGSFYLVDIKQWLPFGHMPASYLEGLIK